MSHRRLLDTSPDAVLIECADLAESLGLVATLREDAPPWVEEVIPGARTVLIRVSRPLSQAQRNRLLNLRAAAPVRVSEEPLEISVDYRGDDLAEVSMLTQLAPEEIVAIHTAQLWTVGFCGFTPGFAYLKGENERLRVPRRDSPRIKVPNGAVGLAGEWSGVYPREGPGGWQLIGRTALPMWDLESDPPATLRPGMRVRFVDATPQ